MKSDFYLFAFLQHLKEKHEAAKKAKEEAEAAAKKTSEAIEKAILGVPTRYKPYFLRHCRRGQKAQVFGKPFQPSLRFKGYENSFK